MALIAKLTKPPIKNSLLSEYDLADSFYLEYFLMKIMVIVMTQSSENICEKLDVVKKGLNGRLYLIKVNFLLILLRIIIFKLSLVRI